MINRTSPIWDLSSEEFATIVESSVTISEVIEKIGLKSNGSTYYSAINKRIREDGLNKDHLIEGARRKSSWAIMGREIKSLDEILVDNSTCFNNRNIKKKLIKAGMIEDRCKECGQGPEWHGKLLVLQLDHINGKNDDNRRENLRLLCPNCHTQTETYSGKNSERNKSLSANGVTQHYCKKCSKSIERGSKSGLCFECWAKTQRKVERPSKEELDELVKSLSLCAIGRKYGVSDSAVRKWIKSYN